MRIFALCLSLALSTFAFSAPKSLELIAYQTASNVQLSPSGQRYAVAESNVDTKILSIYDSFTRNQIVRFDLTAIFGNSFYLSASTWIDDRFIAIQIADELDDKTPLVEANIKHQLLIFDTAADKSSPVIYELTTQGILVNPLIEEAGVFSFARPSNESKIYKIKVEELLKRGQKQSKLTRKDGGQFIDENVITSVDGYVTKWYFDKLGNAVGALRINRDGELSLISLDQTTDADNDSKLEKNVVLKNSDDGDNAQNGKSEKVLKTWQRLDEPEDREEQRLLPIHNTSDPKVFYAIDVNADEITTLYKVDYSNDESEIFYETGTHAIQDVIIDSANNVIGVMVVSNGQLLQDFFDYQKTQSAQAILDITIQERLQNETSNSVVKLHYFESYNDPGSYFLSINDKKHLIYQINQSSNSPLNNTQIIGFVQNDEWQIQYLLNIPNEPMNEPGFPLIIMPHGGPFGVHDTPYFDASTQFFVENGYAVLRVNYRGSSGFGLDFKNAGKKEWGGKLIEDISLAFNKVIERQDINQQKICSLGMSYGGYAAIMLGIRNAEQIKCIISVAGVTDLPLYLKHDNLNTLQEKWMLEWVGNHPDDLEELYAISPINHVDGISAPLLLIHGSDDEVVDAEHAYRLHLLLEKLNVEHEFKIFEDTGHHFRDADTRVKLYETMLNFLDQSLR